MSSKSQLLISMPGSSYVSRIPVLDRGVALPITHREAGRDGSPWLEGCGSQH